MQYSLDSIDTNIVQNRRSETLLDSPIYLGDIRSGDGYLRRCVEGVKGEFREMKSRR